MVTVRRAFLKVLRLAFALAAIVVTASAVDAATAAWDPNTEPNVVGYKLSYGTEPGVHGTTIDVGNVTTFQFNPPAGRRYYVVVQAYDSSGGLSPKSAEATVDIPAVVVVNRAPTLTQPADQITKQDAAVSLALVASDPDGTAVTYSSTGLPPGLSLHASSGIISGLASKAGSYPVTVTVSDGALSASRSFTWTVTAPVQENRAPTLVQPADQNSKQDTTVSLTLVASDPDGTALTYSSTGLPPGLSLHASSGIISGLASQAGSYPVTVTVSDGALSASRSFTWTVTAPVQENRAPTLVQPADQSNNQDTTVSLTLVASDPDGTALTFSATGLPPGLSLGSTSGIIAGKGSKAGSYTVTATVSDGALSANRSFKWTIIEVAAPTANRAPTLNNVPDQRDKPNASVSLQLRGSDPDGTALTYSASGLPAGLSVNATSGLISGVVSTAGVYQVTATASDGTLSANRSFTWTISASNGKNDVSTSVVSQDSSVTEPVVPDNDDARVRFQSAGRLSGVTALHDGRLLLIENERSLSVLEPGNPVSQTILADGDARHAFSEVAVNTRFPATHHVFVGVVRRLDETTSDFSVVRYRELNGNLGEGAAIVSGLRFSGAGTPRFVVDDDARVYVAMPETDRSDIYSAGILRFDADGSVPKENRAASPLWAQGFSQPATLGFHGPSLLATGADRRWSYPAAQINPASPSKDWPQTLEPVSLGSSASVVAAAFGSTSTESSGLRAFVDSSGRLFRLSVDSRSFENVAIPQGLTPISAAAGFDGQIYLIAGAGTGEFVVLEYPRN